jgi:ML domain
MLSLFRSFNSKLIYILGCVRVKMFLFTCISALMCILEVTAVYRNCGSSSDLAKNLVISIVPDAPVAGQEVTTTFDYDLEQVITGGTASYGFTFNGIPFSPTVNDLCTEQAGGCCPDPCPLGVGHHSDKSISTFPSVSGKIVTTIKWSDETAKPILCVEWTVKA